MDSTERSEQEQEVISQTGNSETSNSVETESATGVNIFKDTATTNLSASESTEENLNPDLDTTNRFLNSILNDSSSAVEPFSSQTNSSTNSPNPTPSTPDLTDDFSNNASNELGSRLEESATVKDTSSIASAEKQFSENASIDKHNEISENKLTSESDDKSPVGEDSNNEEVPTQVPTTDTKKTSSNKNISQISDHSTQINLPMTKRTSHPSDMPADEDTSSDYSISTSESISLNNKNDDSKMDTEEINKDSSHKSKNKENDTIDKEMPMEVDDSKSSEETTTQDQDLTGDTNDPAITEDFADADASGTKSSANQNENPVFVHVDTENGEKNDIKEDAEKNMQLSQEEEDFRNSQPQEDPIGGDCMPMEEDEMEHGSEEDQVSGSVQMVLVGQATEEEQGMDEEQGASEELCLIPDTEHIISQGDKGSESIGPGVMKGNSVQRIAILDSNKAIVLTTNSQTSTGVIEKYMLSLYTDEDTFSCLECSVIRRPKYKTVTSVTSKTYYICEEDCLQKARKRLGEGVICNAEGDLRVKNLTGAVNRDNMITSVKFVRKCKECSKNIVSDSSGLSWETMEFCNETCLLKYQKKTGSQCANCKQDVKSNCLGKYCVRFGYDVKQFCSCNCLEEHKKGLKVCYYCQKDISTGREGFLAPAGEKGQFRDFCTQACVEMHDLNSGKIKERSKGTAVCVVCLTEKPVAIEFSHDGDIKKFCGEHCFVAFKFVKNIVTDKCNLCQKIVDDKVLEKYSIYYDKNQHNFCSKTCQNVYIISQRRIVPCNWCKVKKYNFDMIKRNNGPDALLLCSLNCLNLYHVSMNAASMKRVDCDQCHKNMQPVYHLSMSDATIRNFCSHPCVMLYQNKFSTAPLTLNEDSFPVPTSGPKKTRRTYSSKKTNSVATVTPPPEIPTIPVISSVQSLAMTNGPASGTRNGKSKNNSEVPMNSYQVKTQIKQQIIVKPTPVPSQRNIATMCKVITATKGVNASVTTCDQEIQTERIPDKKAIIPIPVPIYVPSPAWMYSMPFPVPFPFPLPVPVPIFIPTTRNSANGIMKEIKKIQVKIPTDPYEAELLMMAEMVAGDKKEEPTDSESDDDDAPGTAAADASSYTSEPADTSNTFGEDMLQMALKMATELEEPAVDLEGALTANTITAQQNDAPTSTEEMVDDPQPINPIMERPPTVRGRKRPGRPPRTAAPCKRGRRSSNQMDISMMAPPPPPPLPQEPMEKPDANMCLKYTFGVNAWKQWVTTKNIELEKSSRRVKLFKPEILQLTSDELNYSLCLFVKEVRKPNGQEYAPDTIYYLCLGIQQYLFENGRIDNIFCDAYYEKFTDHLDEVARKFSVLYNDSHYIVTRVEEEHLWESKQLGAHSPHVLLSTLMFFNTKHFNLTTVDEHMQLSFSHIMKHWKRNPNQPGPNKVAGSRNVLLRFYPPQNINDSTPRKKKVYEQQENEDNPLRCPVKLYEFYLSKCPESVKTRNDVFYLLPERSCVPDSPVWYSTMPLPKNALEKMLHRVKMVKEINVALLTS